MEDFEKGMRKPLNILGVTFAPLYIPLERRIQGHTLLSYIFSVFVIEGTKANSWECLKDGHEQCIKTDVCGHISLQLPGMN
jgi:hypothetical protein